MQRTSSATSSHFEGDFHYMSPERLAGGKRSAANDMWSVGATFVHMISGKPLNHVDGFPLLAMNISQYKLRVNGTPYNEYLSALNENDIRKRVLSSTLCTGFRLGPIAGNCYGIGLFPHSERLPAAALCLELIR